MTQFGRAAIYIDNSGAPVAPTVNDDVTQNYGVGSRWFHTALNCWWRCIDATQGAAKWVPEMAGQFLGRLIGANMNSTGDQQFTMYFDLPSGFKYLISGIVATNCAVSLTTAAGGVYTAAAKGGTALVANSQGYTGLTGTVTQALSLTLAAGATGNVWDVAPYLSLTTAQGAAATADFYIKGDVIPGS